MKQLILTYFLFILAMPVFSQFSISGGRGVAYEIGSANEVLKSVYLFNSLSGASISYTPSSVSATVKFYKYNATGNRTEITLPGGGFYQIDNLEDANGYIAVEAGEEVAAVWIIDYNMHPCKLTSVTVEENEKERCEEVISLRVVDESDILQYYTTTGGQRSIERLYSYKYKNKQWNNKTDTFDQIEQGEENYSFYESILIVGKENLPLENTTFTVSGDQFSDALGISRQSVSVDYTAVAVDAHILWDIEGEGEDESEANTREDGEDGDYSAPLIVNFYGHTNEPTANHFTWYVYDNSSSDPDNWIFMSRDRDMTYTFSRAGTFRVVFEVSNTNAPCMVSVEVEKPFVISESLLKVPNYFSPGDSPGVNDEFKVKYKSLIRFRCTIFNRWGNKLFQFDDPEKGWDGKYKGKYVNPGVYFYVIDAEGSEGKKYKMGGDINILRSK